MIHKEFIEVDGEPIARVTFRLPNSVWADTIYLVGDFNNWHRTSWALERNRAGEWFSVVHLNVGRAYQFRYLCDNNHWMNDSDADAYVPNPHGSDNFVVVTDASFALYHGDGWHPDQEED